VGQGARLGAECAVAGLAVVGPGSTIGDGNQLDHGLRVGADIEIPAGAVRFS